ncbi:MULTISPECIES: MinD/ParA family protein [Desulfitobacterium]|uniref:ATPase involved in chromosome partitioning n=1 Tax=Desulfitobacterium dehalogenans (strain ATCC 51507 / DSM 9161 / JW/IU-DC1) TaxID=756499 RepID=I4ACV5_DESDJ|nr:MULTISPECIES: MinD/ParA family protein [Desulfitobacterium]AFM01790.1 ATPase involved in chromosome partitioning [Desulfitobacterium dehalogenans ATCC 51507]
MNDQAKVLKRIASRHKSNSTSNPNSQQGLRVFAVTSGKGGVGKTNFSVNLGLALIDLGYRVILLDGDLGLANLDIACGVTPRYTFEHLLNGEKDIEEILIYGPKGIGILPGGSGVQDLANIERDRLEEVVRNLGRLEGLADIIIIDTGAGLGYTVLNFLRAADDIILITTPEPTSLTDAYGLLKALQKVKDNFTVNVVVNRVQKESDAKDTYERLESAAKRFLNASVNLLGWVYEDMSVGRAIMKQEPIGVSYPRSTAYQCIQWIASSVSGLYLSPPRQAGGIRGFLTNLLRTF